MEARIADVIVLGTFVGVLVVVAGSAALFISPLVKRFAERVAKFLPADTISKNEQISAAIEQKAREEAETQSAVVAKTLSDNFQKQIDSLRADRDRDRTQFQQEREHDRQQFLHAQKRGDEAEVERRKIQEQMQQILQDRVKSSDEMAGLSRQLVELRGELKNITTERDMLSKENARAWKEVDDLKLELKTTRDDLHETQAQMHQLELRLERLSGERDVMKELLDKVEFLEARKINNSEKGENVA